jgi:O-antigen/teichoic acid export membrane protein
MNTPYSELALRNSIFHFFSGKVMSALLTFALLILLARALDSRAYGAYATLVAMLELGFGLGSLGLGWVSQRYVPEYRLHATTEELRRLIWGIFQVQATALACVAIVVFLLHGLLARYLHLQDYLPALAIYCAVLFVDGLGRAVRDNIFAAFLQQGFSQSMLVLKNFLLLTLAAAGWAGAILDLTHLGWMELSAASVATMLTVAGLRRYLAGMELQRHPTWQAPELRDFIKTAYNMYVSSLLTLAKSTQAFVFLVNAMMGLEAAAIFGFARNLNVLLLRYLPAELTIGIIRPKLTADYTQHRDMKLLGRQGIFLWKISLIVLAPALGFCIICGSHFASLISAGKFTQAGPIIAGLTVSLIPFSQRRILETLANILGHSEACVRASVLSVMAFPLSILLIHIGMGLWGVVTAALVAEIASNYILVMHIQRAGCPYHITLSMLLKLIFVIAGVSGALLPFLGFSRQGWGILITQGLLAALVTLFLATWLAFFSTEERGYMQRFFKTQAA